MYVSCYDGHTIRKIENNVVQTAGQFNTSGNTNGQNVDYYPNHMVYVLTNAVDLYVSEFDGSIRVLSRNLMFQLKNLSSYLDDPDYTRYSKYQLFKNK